MTVQVDDVNNVAQVQQDITTLLRARHHLVGPVSSSQGQRNGRRNPARGLGLGGGFGRPVEVDRKGQPYYIRPPISRAYDAQHRNVYSRVDPCGQPGGAEGRRRQQTSGG